MAATYEPIASTTLGSDVASVTFTSIPGTYTDLVVVAKFGTKYSGGSAVQTEVYGRFNSATTTYSYTQVYGSGSSALSNRGTGRVGVLLGQSDLTTNNVFISHVMSHSNTNVYKTVLSSHVAPGRSVARSVALWQSTAAITSLEIGRFGASVDLTAGSTFSLYGIKAA